GPRGRDETSKQSRLHRIFLLHGLWMPLDTEGKRMTGPFDRFDEAVGRVGRGDKTRGHLADRLVVERVDAATRHAEGPSEQAALRHVHTVGGVAAGSLLPVLQARAGLRRDVLVKSPSRSHVEHLHAAAYAEDGHSLLQRPANEGQFEAVTHGLDGTVFGRDVLPV